MKQLKIIKYFSLIIIVVSIFYMTLLNISRKVKINSHEKVIDNMVSNNTSYNYINNNIIGYLEIENVKIKNIIKISVSDKVLDENVIGMLESSEIGRNNSDVFLAGHNIKEVFRNLHLIKKGDIVKITTNDSCYRYEVNKILIVNDYEINYLLNTYNNKLIMMTCTNQNNKRLIVIANLI